MADKHFPNQKQYLADLRMGQLSEANTLQVLKKILGQDIRKSKKPYAVLDYYSSCYKTKAEVKGRRNSKYKYPTTMIGENKIKEAQRLLEKGYEVFFFFDFTDKLCYFKISELDTLRSFLKMGGTYKRGLREWKLYRWVNVNDLTDISNYDEPIYYNKTKKKFFIKKQNKTPKNEKIIV